MAVSEFLAKYGTIVKPTITLASLANGAGRLSAIIDNTTVRAPMAQVFVRITTGGTAPTNGNPVRVYLVRHSNDGTLDLADNGLGTADAALAAEPVDAEQIGAIIVTAATNTTYTRTFLAYDLSPDYNIAIWNATGQALNATAGNFAVQVLPITMEAQ